MVSLIHPQYKQQVPVIQEAFSVRAPKVVILDEFLQKDELKRIESLLKPNKRKEVGVPDQYRLHEVQAKSVIDFFEHDSALRAFMGMILGKIVKEVKVKVLELHASDYSVLHDKLQENGVAEFLLFFSDGTKGAGGAKVFIANNEKTEVLAKRNRFVLIEKKNVQSYWQYCNHTMGKNRILVIQGLIK